MVAGCSAGKLSKPDSVSTGQSGGETSQEIVVDGDLVRKLAVAYDLLRKQSMVDMVRNVDGMATFPARDSKHAADGSAMKIGDQLTCVMLKRPKLATCGRPQGILRLAHGAAAFVV